MRVRADANFFLSLILIFLINPADYTFVFLCACAVHEMGHVVFLKIFNIKKAEISLGLAGANISADTSRISYAKELVIYMGGAFFNLAFAVVLLCFLHCRFEMLTMFFFLSNVFLALINLIPSKSLDGGRALECVLCMFFDPFVSEKITLWVSFFSSLLIAVTGAFAVFSGELNLTFLLFASTLVFESVYRTYPFLFRKNYCISG